MSREQGWTSADVAAALSPLVERFGATEVLIALRDGCDAMTDLGDGNRGKWREASAHLEAAAVAVAARDANEAGLEVGLLLMSQVEDDESPPVPDLVETWERIGRESDS